MSLVAKCFATIILAAVMIGFMLSMSLNASDMPLFSQSMLVHVLGQIVPLLLLMLILRPRPRVRTYANPRP